VRYLLRLYPAWWRTRYEEEFLTLFGSLPVTLLVAVDLLRGALDARLADSSIAEPRFAEQSVGSQTGVARYLHDRCGREASRRSAVLGGVLTGSIWFLAFALPGGLPLTPSTVLFQPLAYGGMITIGMWPGITRRGRLLGFAILVASLLIPRVLLPR
jgi:hypothetical protein